MCCIPELTSILIIWPDLVYNFSVLTPPGPNTCTHSPTGKSPQLLATRQPNSQQHQRTHPGRPPNPTQQACGRFDCKLRPSLRLHISYPGSRGLLCRSSLRLLGFSESDDRGWPSQAAGRTGQRPAWQRPGSHQERSKAASSSVLSTPLSSSSLRVHACTE